MSVTLTPTQSEASAIHNVHPPAHGALPHYSSRTLVGEDWLDRVMALHAQVRAEMPESQRHFLLPKPPEYFRDLLTEKTGALVGVFVDEKLAGFMAVVRTESFAVAHAAGRITCPDDDGRLAAAFGVGEVGVCQSMCVLNAYLGRGMSRLQVQAAVAWARRHECRHLFAQVADQNMLSWMRFLDEDFSIVATWESGHRRFLLRWLPPEEKARQLRDATPLGLHVFRKDYAQVPALVAELTAKVQRGHIVFLDNMAHEAGALRFVFGQVAG